MESGKAAGSPITIEVLPPNNNELVSSIKQWVGPSEADLRVLFTPDVLISLDRPDRSGYLYDDGWTVEVWIGRGGDLLLQLLSTSYLAEHCTVEQPPKEPGTHSRLHELAQQSGSPFNEVRHLI